MRGGVPGIPSSFIDDWYAHGETAEFGSAGPLNRRVTVRLQGGGSAPPPPPQNGVATVVPCTALPKHIFSRGACGAGTDFTHNDFPSLSGVGAAEQAAVWEADNLTLDFQLRNRMRTELGILAGSEGIRMVSHFAGRNGRHVEPRGHQHTRNGRSWFCNVLTSAPQGYPRNRRPGGQHGCGWRH
jgi:hypothetical protein